MQQNIPTFGDIKKSQVTHLVILYINKHYDICEHITNHIGIPRGSLWPPLSMY